jgi:hypothetical protein
VPRIGLFHKNNSFAEAKSLVLQLPVPHVSRTVAQAFLAGVFEEAGILCECGAGLGSFRRFRSQRQPLRRKGKEGLRILKQFIKKNRTPSGLISHLRHDTPLIETNVLRQTVAPLWYRSRKGDFHA